MDLRFPVGSENGLSRCSSITGRRSQIKNGFTLVEVLVVVSLLSLIVLALMAVFNSTQSAFRASVTQSDVLEGGRSAMDLISTDLRGMSSSLQRSNGAVNFYAAVPSGYLPLVQSLVASGQSRTNVLENFFILSRQNQTWTGTGYVVGTGSVSDINPLYRFSMSTNVASADPWWLFYHFTNDVANDIANNSFTNMSRLMDGVVHLTVRAFDVNGGWMTNQLVFSGNQAATNRNTFYLQPALGEVGFQMFSNTLPASVEIQMGVLEDRTLQRAESIPDLTAQSNYLAQQSGKVHIFRQRVSIPNVDPAAYQ